MKKTLLLLVILIMLLVVFFFITSKYKEENIQQEGLESSSTFSFILKKVTAHMKREAIKSYKHIEYKHLTLYYSDEDQNLIIYTQKALDRGIKLNEKFIGFYDEPHDIVIFKNSKDMKKITNQDQLSGFHSTDLNMTGILPEDREALENEAPPMLWAYNRTIMHEYTHYVLEHKFKELSLLQEEIPYWFTEGFADYIGNDEMGITITDNELLPLSEITSAAQWRHYNQDQEYNIYLQSYLAVRFLIQTYGDKIVLDILNETKLTKNFSTAFKNIVGVEIDDFEYNDENF